MKITKQQLKQIIKEELRKVLNENEVPLNSSEGQVGSFKVSEQGIELKGMDGKSVATKDNKAAIIPIEIAKNWDELPNWLVANLAGLDEDGDGIDGTNIADWGLWIADQIDDALSGGDDEEEEDDWDYSGGGQQGGYPGMGERF